MSPDLNPVDIKKLAEIALAGTYNGIEARIKKIDFNWEVKEINAEGTFCYLTFKDGYPSEDDFDTFIYHKIVPFCLPRDYIRLCRENLSKTKHERFFFEPVDEAKKLFIKAKEKLPKSGEPAEVVLFTLLEGFLNAPRIVAKMRLKTNPNMEVLGSDAIHMKYEPDSETLKIYWGESKLYQDLPSALSQIAKSITDFRKYNDQIGGSLHDFDVSIIQAHPDLDTPFKKETREALLAYFNPYSQFSNKIQEIHACLAIWDWPFYQEISRLDPEKAEEVFREKYLERITSACALFIEKIKSHNLERFRFHFLLIPMRSVLEFRRRFYGKLGIPFTEECEKKEDE